MAVVAVGDFDAEAVVAMLTEALEDVRSRGAERPQPIPRQPCFEAHCFGDLAFTPKCFFCGN